jgi:hypothetical protein
MPRSTLASKKLVPALRFAVPNRTAYRGDAGECTAYINPAAPDTAGHSAVAAGERRPDLLFAGAAGDIPAGTQGGFTFDSPVNPDQFCACDFEVVLIARSMGALAPITVVHAPEPVGFAAGGVLVVTGRIGRRRRRALAFRAY